MVAGILLIITLFLINSAPVLAVSPPTQTSPTDQSTASSSQVNWQSVDEANEYRVIIDDDPNVTSPYLKDYYTTSLKYSPQLSPGTYYWKVKSRDTNNTWSNWSPIWSFTLSANSTSTSSPNPTNSPNLTESDFTISQIPSSINSNQSFSASINLSLPNSTNTKFYLKGAFKKADSSNYFGFTKVNDVWIKNSSSSLNQLPVTTDSNGHWSGTIDVMPDSEDSGFIGTGSYGFRVARYGSSPSWSNEVSLNIIAINPPAPSASSKTSSKTSTASPIPDHSFVPYSSNLPKTVLASTNSATVAGLATSAALPAEPSTDTTVQGNQQFNFLPFLGGGLILLSVGLFVYIYLKSRYNSNS